MESIIPSVIPLMVVLPCVKVDTFALGLLIVIVLIESHVR